MRTTAPANLTSIAGAAGAARATGAGSGTSVMIGTKSGATVSVVLAATVAMFRHTARRQPNTCCEQTCQRRATSDTRAPGARLSSTIRAFSSADQRRQRPGPISTSTRRYSPFASSLTSNITIARCPLPWATQPPSRRPLKKGVRAPLTEHPDLQVPANTTYGSSPHARGTRTRGQGATRPCRFIPACAGNTEDHQVNGAS
jgi:hypothetical protein